MSATDEPGLIIEYSRESIHPGDDPIPLTIEFPPQTTITDLMVTLAESQTRFFAYRRGRSSWNLWHIAGDGARHIIGLVQFDNVTEDAEQTLVFVSWGDPYWGRSLTEELYHEGAAPVRIEATSTHGGPIATVRQWNSYTSAAPRRVVDRPWGAT